MLAKPEIIDAVCDCVSWADRLTRSDLICGSIVSENDYTSNFTSAIRREINARNIPGLSAYSQVLKSADERRTGTDACIIFRNKKAFKVGLFEAKWPRLSFSTNCWDSLQKSTKTSHFDTQISRQNGLNGFAVWEMFYCEEKFGGNSLFPTYGSSCVWHSDVFQISTARNQKQAWTDVELTNLLGKSCVSIDKVAREICSCRIGKPFSTNSMDSVLREFNVNAEIVVINMESDNEEFVQSSY